MTCSERCTGTIARGGAGGEPSTVVVDIEGRDNRRDSSTRRGSVEHPPTVTVPGKACGRAPSSCRSGGATRSSWPPAVQWVGTVGSYPTRTRLAYGTHQRTAAPRGAVRCARRAQADGRGGDGAAGDPELQSLGRTSRPLADDRSLLVGQLARGRHSYRACFGPFPARVGRPPTSQDLLNRCWDTTGS